MRKNLTSVPVYVTGQTKPIDHISVEEADHLVAIGRAWSLKGKAIRLLSQDPPERRTRSLSPDHHLMERYVEAQFSGQDPAAIKAIDGLPKSKEHAAVPGWGLLPEVRA